MSTNPNTSRAEAPVRLSPISYVVLGVIGLRGPSTPYQLKQAIERSVRYFWPFPHSQLYGEPERLSREGLLDQEVEEGGRRRRVYSLTSSGQEALENWLKTPPGEVFEMRDMAVLQLFFSEFTSTAELVKLAEDQVRLYKERLAVYQAIIEHNEGRESATRRMAPLNLGVRMATACLEFWSGIAENPPPGRE
ncbi:PadR family transcriptional regulator [Paraburkholderia nodosa]|uniref:PadR family transcriptional regulator n=1 Tax=Paraburkholderia nodosa TaxID=392320 RepID=UPI00048A3AC4|nr:PadR family transcriptional regulator [Paraburkholderia nodosa]